MKSFLHYKAKLLPSTRQDVVHNLFLQKTEHLYLFVRELHPDGTRLMGFYCR